MNFQTQHQPYEKHWRTQYKTNPINNKAAQCHSGCAEMVPDQDFELMIHQ